MTKLTIFCRQASVDTYVTLRLTHGEDVSGHITELDDAHVCLDLGDGKVITVFEDILAGWEIHQGIRAGAAVEESSGHQPEEDRTCVGCNSETDPSRRPFTRKRYHVVGNRHFPTTGP